MSEHTIARWNAIPLDRPDESVPASLKRGRPDDMDDDEGDNVSLVSRSPSPSLHDNSMDVDDHIHKYDEYVRGPAREVITVETKIKPSNKGFALLAKLGWVEGQPVGLSGDGRVDPIPFQIKSDLTGLGKTSQDVRMIETTVSQRRELDSERQQRESEEQRKLREDTVARKSALESEISSTLRAFYCTLCDKQFKNVAQYDEHTNSYAHHHKARFKDMQANVRLKPQEEVDKRKEKERRREEKELRKIAAAQGIKMPKPAALPGSFATPLANPPPSDTSTSMEIDGKPIEPKKSGWESTSESQGPSFSSNSKGGFTKSSWATVGSTSSTFPPSSSHSSYPTSAPSRFGQPAPSHSSNTNSPSLGSNIHSESEASTRSSHIPTFRNAGWTSLDTGSSQLQHPPSSQPPPVSPFSAARTQASVSTYDYPPQPSNQGGWRASSGFNSTASGEIGSSSSQWPSSFAPSAPTDAPPPPPPAFQPAPIPVTSSVPPPPAPARMPPAAAKPRSNWQQFQKGVGRRK